MHHTKAAVMGAGAMGSGIALALASASIEVELIDVSNALVEKGVERIDGRCTSDVRKGKLSDDEKARIMGRIRGTIDRTAASDVDLVIEAIVEDRELKGEVFEALDRICGPKTVFATNTSTLSVTDLATLSGRPEKFLGLHFFNPVHAMKLVEVIPGLDTDKDVVEEAYAAMKAIKKVPILVQDCPGFLVNRILLSYMNEALLAAEEGISPEEIDGEAKKAGFPMGPLELSDLVGWDVSLHTFPNLHTAYGDRFPVLRLVPMLNDAGRLGDKCGKGIYNNGQIDDEFRGMVASLGPKGSNAPFTIDRLILREVNEAVYCLQEGVASLEGIDKAMVLGTGFPNEAGVGGPLHWADEKGLDWVLAALEGLAAAEGSRFWPHHLLKTYVAARRLGRKTKKGFFEYD
jgi:3-hydroxyacyl-CoA dehydrogenase